MGITNIEWADKVWNPVTGCTKVSEGCRNCYAERMSKRLAGRCGYPEDGFKVTLHPDKLDEPLRWRKPARIFVCSIGDLFHEAVPDEFVDRVFAVMALSPQHTFLMLTKRPERMRAYLQPRSGMGNEAICRAVNDIPYGLGNRHGALSIPLSNVYLGVSVEDQKTADERIPLLLQTPAAKRFVSYEPALGPVDFHCIPWPEGWRPENDIISDGIDPLRYHKAHLDQIIMGGESGPGARPMHPDWARSVRDQCKAAGVAYFFKQWGEWAFEDQALPTDFQARVHIWPDGKFSYRVGKKAAGCLLDGVEHKEVAE